MTPGKLVDLVEGIEVVDMRVHRRGHETYATTIPAYERTVTIYKEGDRTIRGRLGTLVMGPDGKFENDISAFSEDQTTPYRDAKPIFDALDER